MSYELTPRQRAYIRKKSKPIDLDPSEMAGELNIIPFLDIVVNLIMFLLMATSSIAFFAQLEANLPTYGAGGGVGSDTRSQPLNLNLTITENGSILTGSGGKLAPGCQTVATGAVITVPNKGKDHDWAGLTRCVSIIKKTFEDETEITVSADPLISFEQLIQAMDSVRETKEGDELFPDVMLSAGIR